VNDRIHLRSSGEVSRPNAGYSEGTIAWATATRPRACLLDTGATPRDWRSSAFLYDFLLLRGILVEFFPNIRVRLKKRRLYWFASNRSVFSRGALGERLGMRRNSRNFSTFWPNADKNPVKETLDRRLFWKFISDFQNSNPKRTCFNGDLSSRQKVENSRLNSGQRWTGLSRPLAGGVGAYTLIGLLELITHLRGRDSQDQKDHSEFINALSKEVKSRQSVRTAQRHTWYARCTRWAG